MTDPRLARLTDPRPGETLEDVVERVLLAWEKLFQPRHAVDAEMVDLWIGTVAVRRVGAAEFARAATELTTRARFFPRPAELIDLALELRANNRALAERARLASLVDCVDEHGVSYMALPEQVQDGVLIPEAREGGGAHQAVDPVHRDARRDAILGGLSPRGLHGRGA